MAKIEVLKNVYFVRHGESSDNIRPVFQALDTPLSDKGKEQAKKIADRATRINFEALISSTYNRAVETADAISKATGKIVERSDLFVERIKPSVLNGKPHDDPVCAELWKSWEETLYKKGIKVEDGENYEEIVARADRALELLKNNPEKNIFVVTHGFFFRVMMARVILGDSMTGENLKNFQATASMQHTGLSVLQYSKWNNETSPRWRFLVYNDHSHLG